MSSNRVVIFDCQLLQTKAWHRGMGKYTARTLAAFFGNKEYYGNYQQLVLLFNSNLAYADDLKGYVEGMKNVKVVFLPLAVPQDGDPHSITVGQEKNKATLDGYIAAEYPDSTVGFLITSLFLDEACPVFPSTTYNSLIYYDLIPLMYYRLYLGLGASEQYFTRFGMLLDADRIFAISETVANDLVAFLGVPKEKVVNIRGASNRAEKIVTSRPGLDITKPFVLMPTGGDPRKNNLNGVKGFGRFNEQNGNRFQLVITSFFTEGQKEELRQYCPDIIFSGNVADSEVWWLYENAEAVLFPAEYEGLGMPILEAIDVDKLIVCSDIAVFREISTEAFFMFDPRDPEAISASLEEVFSATPEEIALKKQHYQAISDYYTWDGTAAIIDSMLLDEPRRIREKRRIAFVTPSLNMASEEARYIAKLYPHLRPEYLVDFYYGMTDDDDLPVRPNHLVFATKVQSIELLTPKRHASYDLVVYMLGNDKASVSVLQAALAMPGLALLADGALDVTYEEAHAMGVMSSERRAKESGACLQTLTAVSRAVMTFEAGKMPEKIRRLPIIAPNLAYPPKRGGGLYGNVFVAIDASRDDTDWNVDVVNDIARVVDKSRASFSVVTRTKLPEGIRKLFDLSDVLLYEEVSDHEYFTLLNNSDLYVDARPGAGVSKLMPAFEAYRNGLDVILGPIDGVQGWWKEGVLVARDGESLRDGIFKWLIQGTSDESDGSLELREDAAELSQAIKDVINGEK